MNGRRSIRRGFTLLELTLALALASVLMLAIGSAVVLASRAIPSGRGGPESAVAAAKELDALLADLQYALRVESRTATSIELLVADRDGDGADDRIRYAWSKAGDPLTRSINGGTAAPVVDRVAGFQLAYTVKSYKLPPTEVQSSEQLFFSLNSLLSLSAFSVDINKWPAQQFMPTGLPSEALNWRVTRVKFLARQNGSSAGRTRVEVQLADSSWLPNGVIVADTSFLESDLSSSYEWKEVSFGQCNPIPRNQAACIVFRHLADTVSCDLRYVTLSSPLGYAQMNQTTNGGMSWSAKVLQGMQLYAWGTYGIKAPDQYRYELTAVRSSLKLSDGGTLESSVALLNAPEVSAP